MVMSRNIEFVPQVTATTCWAACFAMLLNFRDGTKYTDIDIVNWARTHPSLPHLSVASGADDPDYPFLFELFQFENVPGRCMNPASWEALLAVKPHIVGIPGHLVVASHTNDQPDQDSFRLYVLDQWNGGAEKSFQELEDQYELRADRDVHMIRSQW